MRSFPLFLVLIASQACDGSSSPAIESIGAGQVIVEGPQDAVVLARYRVSEYTTHVELQMLIPVDHDDAQIWIPHPYGRLAPLGHPVRTGVQERVDLCWLAEPGGITGHNQFDDVAVSAGAVPDTEGVLHFTLQVPAGTVLSLTCQVRAGTAPINIGIRSFPTLSGEADPTSVDQIVTIH